MRHKKVSCSSLGPFCTTRQKNARCDDMRSIFRRVRQAPSCMTPKSAYQNESLHRKRAFLRLARKAKQAVRGRSMEPDAVQTQNKPFECRVILRRCCKASLRPCNSITVSSSRSMLNLPVGTRRCRPANAVDASTRVQYDGAVSAVHPRGCGPDPSVVSKGPARKKRLPWYNPGCDSSIIKEPRNNLDF